MDTEEPSLGLKTRASVALLGRGEPLRPPPVLRPGPPAPPARPECPVRGPPRQTLTRCPRSARRSREAQVDRVPWKLAPPPPSVCAPRGWADSKGRCGAGPRMTWAWHLLPSAQALTPPGRRASAGGAGLQQLVPRRAVRSCFVGSVTSCEGGPGSPRLHGRARQLSRDAAVDAEWGARAGRGPCCRLLSAG